MTSPAPVKNGGQFASLRDDSVAALERALRLKPEDLGQEVDTAERLVVRLRDCLIEWIRPGDSAGHRWQTALDQVNAALSLIVGVEYPAVGIQRSLLEQARESLKALQADAN